MRYARYRVERITITPLGTVLVFVASILIGLSAIILEAWIAYIGVGLAAIILSSLAYARLSAASLASQVRVERSTDDYLVEGYPAKVRLRISNPRLIHIGPVVVEELEPRGIRVLDRIGLIPLIPPRGSVEVAYRVVPRVGKRCYRGVRYRGWDPLGLFEYRVTNPSGKEDCIRTLPLLMQITEAIKARGKQAFEGTPSVKMRGIETYQLREYVAGDDARLIEWKATARLGQLIVRETLSEASGNYTIIVVGDSRGWAGQWLQTPYERGIRLAVSIARELALKGFKVAFQVVTPDGSWRVEGSKSDVVNRILKLVAEIPEPSSVMEGVEGIELPGREGIIIAAGPEIGEASMEGVRVIDVVRGGLRVEQAGPG